MADRFYRQKEKIEPVNGWVLVTRDRDTPFPSKLGGWYIAWHEVFSTKKRAVGFATENGWMPPYRAVRAKLAAN